MLCSGADKLRKIITLFVLVAINAANPPAHASAQDGGTTVRCHKDAYHSINMPETSDSAGEAWRGVARASSLIFAICEKLLFMCLHPLPPL